MLADTALQATGIVLAVVGASTREERPASDAARLTLLPSLAPSFAGLVAAGSF